MLYLLWLRRPLEANGLLWGPELTVRARALAGQAGSGMAGGSVENWQVRWGAGRSRGHPVACHEGNQTRTPGSTPPVRDGFLAGLESAGHLDTRWRS